MTLVNMYLPTVQSRKSASAHFNKIDAINAGPITLILMTIILIFIACYQGNTRGNYVSYYRCLVAKVKTWPCFLKLV